MNRRAKNPSIQEAELYDKITKIQTKIIDQISLLKRDKPQCDCKHFQALPQSCQAYDSSIDYYQKFWKGFLLNEVCYARLQDTRAKLDQLSDHLADIDYLFDHHQQLLGGRGSKRNRRQAHEVDKTWACPYQRCFKNYGSEISLNLHMKLKHNGGNKSERDKAAELIWQARESNRPIPIFYINLPPGFVQEYGRARMPHQNNHNSDVYLSD